MVFRNGFKILWDCLVIFIKFPVLIIPVAIAWIYHAVMTIYLYYLFPWYLFRIFPVPIFNSGLVLYPISCVIMLLIVTVDSIVLTIVALMILEIIKQIEEGEKISFKKSLNKVFKNDFKQAFPIALIYAILIFILSLLEVILKSRREIEEAQEKMYALDGEGVAQLLANYQKLSPKRLLFSLLRFSITSAYFLILPAIAWEGKSTIEAIKRGLVVMRINLVGFVGALGMLMFAFALLGYPLYLVFKFRNMIPHNDWFLVIIYEGFVGSMVILLIQLYMAELYLWHLKWEAEFNRAQETYARDHKEFLPKIQNIRPPSLLDGVPYLIKEKKKRIAFIEEIDILNKLPEEVATILGTPDKLEPGKWYYYGKPDVIIYFQKGRASSWQEVRAFG